MSGSHSPHLAVLGDRVALGWVLENQRIAFPEPRYRSQLRSFVTGDTLYLYTTRGCFKNPKRDRGRIIGLATVMDGMTASKTPLVIRDRTMPYEAPVRIESLAPVGEGVEIAELADQLSCFPKRDRWSVYLRRSVVPLNATDARLIDRHLAPLTGTLAEHLVGYRDRARMGLRWSSVGAAR